MRVLKVGRAVLLLLLVTMVNSVPTEEVMEQGTEGAGDDGDLEDVESILQNFKRDKQAQTRALEDAGAEEDADDEDPDNSEKDNAISEKESNEEVEAQRKNAFIYQGNTIALQTYVRNHYLGCPGGRCKSYGCPHMDMSGNDWSRCSGEVFEIYRRKGPGVVRSGDKVSLHYPRERGRWLGCAGVHSCGKATCPGQPTMRYGFQNSGKWGPCWGEVYRIFAKGKNVGNRIRPMDDVFLYLINRKLWVSQCSSGHTRLRSCPGTSLPPPSSKFDSCSCETFKIYKKMKC